MEKRVLWQGNAAMAEAAIRGGARFFAGYPITPQTPFAEYLSWRMPEVGGVYVQANSETSVISMVWGASTGGCRALTATAGPGLSLMQEGISGVLFGSIPTVIIDVQRTGPATGGLIPSQMDYNLVTKGCGHGGVHALVYAVSSTQEAVDLVYESFELAEKYRTSVIILTDSSVGEAFENIIMPEFKPVPEQDSKPWALTGAKNRPYRVTYDCSFSRATEQDKAHQADGSDKNHYTLLEQEVGLLEEMYDEWQNSEVRYEEYCMEDAEYLIIAYGTAARIARSAVDELREEGIRVGLFRPISLYPFPKKEIAALSSEKYRAVLCSEIAIPKQFCVDVQNYLNSNIPMYCYTRAGHMTTVDGYCDHVREMVKKEGNK